MEGGKIKYLIADTTAFINVVQLHEYAENILTVPDVIEEVKHKRQIRRLVVLPFDLQVREPNSDCLQYVTNFSKKTGDYASLSAIDLKVIALTYELEREHVGTDHLKTEPCVSRVITSKEKPDELVENFKLVGFYDPSKSFSDSESESDSEREEIEPKNQEDYSSLNEEIQHTEDENSKSVEFNKQNKFYTDSETEEIGSEPKEGEIKPTNQEEENDSLNEDAEASGSEPKGEKINEGDEESATENVEDDYDDDTGWITPANIKKVKKDLEGKVQDEVIPTVACMSTDFAIQNVLKQMNLNVSALNGRVIRHLRTYILRCYTCFATTSVMTKLFCPKCGNKTLKKVAVSLDENGQQVIHINTRRPLTAKYKNKSLPTFKGGKHSRNPLLFEDQPMPRQMPSRVAKTKTNALTEDYTAGYSPFVMRDVDSKSALLRSKGNIKEWARNNTFEEERRRKNYNRLVK